MKVYLLYNYGEHGPEELVATLDRKKLIELFDKTWPDNGNPGTIAWRNKAIERLRPFVESDNEPIINGIDLHDGWGGAVLDIVELQ